MAFHFGIVNCNSVWSLFRAGPLERRLRRSAGSLMMFYWGAGIMHHQINIHIIAYQCISLFNDVDSFFHNLVHITSYHTCLPDIPDFGQRSWPFSTRQISLAQKSWRWPTLMRPSLNRDVTLDVTLKDPNLSSYHPIILIWKIWNGCNVQR